MKCAEQDLLLYAVTDRHWLNGRSLRDVVEESLRGGVTMLQLREKSLAEPASLAEAGSFRPCAGIITFPSSSMTTWTSLWPWTPTASTWARATMEALDVRRKLGPDKIIGVSAQTVEQALLAEKHGADYLGVGAVFPTGSKDDADDVSYDTLKAICRAVSIPVVAIGGISLGNVSQLSGSGICGIAVISAIYGAADIRRASLDLKAATEEMLRS